VQVLTAADVIRGKSCTAYPACRPELELAGAKWVEPSAGYDSAHTDGNLITAPAWPAHPAWVRAFVAALGAPIAT